MISVHVSFFWRWQEIKNGGGALDPFSGPLTIDCSGAMTRSVQYLNQNQNQNQRPRDHLVN